MPWWGWVLIVLAVVIIVPIKLKVLKSMMAKKKAENNDNTEDF